MNTMSYGCELCHYKCPKASNLKTHFDTKKHKANEQAHKSAICRDSTPTKTKGFVCEVCEFDCERRCDYNRHLQTKKHTDLVARLKESNTPKESSEPERLMNILRKNEELNTMLLEERKELQEERKELQEEYQKLKEQRKEFQEHITMVIEERKKLEKYNVAFVIRQTCLSPNCKKIPVYNQPGEKKGLYCSTHKQEGMVDVKNKTCKTELCSTLVGEKYDGYCLRCFMYLFPDKPVSRNYKTKEYSVVEYVNTKFPNYDWVKDKIVNGGCSKRRPDLLLDLGYQVIIVEVDENQHTDYDCSCENKRIMEISQDMGHRPIIFIRFNPDDYIQNGTKISSCWGQTKNGICVVKKPKSDEWSKRLNVLENHINYWINPENTTNKTVEIIQLFYDD